MTHDLSRGGTVPIRSSQRARQGVGGSVGEGGERGETESDREKRHHSRLWAMSGDVIKKRGGSSGDCPCDDTHWSPAIVNCALRIFDHPLSLIT